MHPNSCVIGNFISEWISCAMYHRNHDFYIKVGFTYELSYLGITSYESFNGILVGFIELLQRVIVVEESSYKKVEYFFLTKLAS